MLRANLTEQPVILQLSTAGYSGSEIELVPVTGVTTVTERQRPESRNHEGPAARLKQVSQ